MSDRPDSQLDAVVRWLIGGAMALGIISAIAVSSGMQLHMRQHLSLGVTLFIIALILLFVAAALRAIDWIRNNVKIE